MAQYQPDHLGDYAGKQIFYPGGIPFEIISPDEIVLSEPVDHAEIPGAEGYMDIYPGHVPVMSTLQPGIIKLYRRDKLVWQIYISGGVAEVNFEKITILAEKAWDLPQIDPAAVLEELDTLKAEFAEADNDYIQQKIQSRIDEAQRRHAAAMTQF